ncbi:MAG: hypothetical protein Q4F11_09180, partial [Eubacteriales bacterium]|nr:hypothetical protein [Eubacteriales bacterium]
MIVIMFVIFIGIILFPSISFNGAMTGLTLWAVKVLPALFPAMLITACIMQLLPAASRFAYIYIIVCGIFCGYPNGAFACAQYHINNPDETLCEKIFGCCNISGSAFVVNYIYHNFLYQYIGLLPLLLIIYLPPFTMLMAVLVKYKAFSKKIPQTQPNASYTIKMQKGMHSHTDFPEIFCKAVDTAVENALKLGG